MHRIAGASTLGATFLEAGGSYAHLALSTKEPGASGATRAELNVLSLINPHEAKRLGGLPVEAIAGAFSDDTQRIDMFRPNPKFVEFLHDVIREVGPADPDLRAAAREQGEGYVYIIDLRTPDGPQGRVPPEDIIGAFRVENGQITSDSYEAFPQHQILTKDGLVCLPPSFRAAFVKRLPKVE